MLRQVYPLLQVNHHHSGQLAYPRQKPLGGLAHAGTTGIAKDCADARAYFASAHAAPNHTETRRQTTRDRI